MTDVVPKEHITLNETIQAAYSKFVTDPGDTVGILAFGLYMQIISEQVSSGQNAVFTPVNAMVMQLRGSAERQLEEFAHKVVEEATPNIQESFFSSSLKSTADSIRLSIAESTSFKKSLSSNIAAWAVTLAFTVIVIFSIYLPNWQSDLASKADQLAKPTTKSDGQ